MTRFSVPASPVERKAFLNRILCAPGADLRFRELAETGVLEELIPEVAALQGVTQPPEFHPEGDVFEHTMLMLRHMVFPDLLLGWSVLLHDVGKPLTRSVEESGRIRFFSHEEKGAVMAEEILRRFEFPEQEISVIVHAVRNHMRFASVTGMRKAKLQRLIQEAHFGLELELHRLDCISCHGKMQCFDFLLKEVLQMPVPEAPAWVTGKDLLALGVSPGRKMGELLQKLKELQSRGRFANPQQALEYAKKRIENL